MRSRSPGVGGRPRRTGVESDRATSGTDMRLRNWSVSKYGGWEVESIRPAGRHVLVPVEAEERLASRPRPKLPRHVVGGRPPGTHPPLVDPAEVIAGADREPVV